MLTVPTISPVIQYIYGSHNMQRIDAFNKATLEVINFLNSKEKQGDEQLKEEEQDIHTWNGKPLYKADRPPIKRAKHTRSQKFTREKSLSSNYRKVFDYVVYRKLDYNEIMAFDPQFKSAQDIKAIFANLKKSQFSKDIDSIYKKHGLELPPFSTWTSKDFNKGPS